MDKWAVIFAVALLIFGALNTLSTKMTFQMKSEDLDGHMVAFQKPWFGVYRMFQGMSLVMLLHFAVVLKQRNGKKEMAQDGEYSEMELNGGKKTTWKSYGVVMVPAFLDLFGTVCTYVGLFYNSSSIWQMFRGAMVLFATFFSVTVLKRKLSPCRKFGIFIVMVALTVVGASNMLSTSADAPGAVPLNLRLFGMGMILLGMLLQGGQVVAEELLMRDLGAPPLLVVGMEGVWGCILCLVFVFPVVGHMPGSDYGGVQESFENDVEMVKNSEQLQKVIVVYLVSVFTFNIAGMMVTYQLSAVHRTLLEASRTAVIWAVDLAIHHYMPDSSFGESWNDYSWLQLLGFILLVIGQATYGEFITWGFQTSAAAKLPSPRMSPMASPAGQLIMNYEIPDEE